MIQFSLLRKVVVIDIKKFCHFFGSPKSSGESNLKFIPILRQKPTLFNVDF